MKLKNNPEGGETSRLEPACAVRVCFNRVSWRWYLPPEAELVEQLNLRVLVREEDGTLYEAGDGVKLPEKSAGKS